MKLKSNLKQFTGIMLVLMLFTGVASAGTLKDIIDGAGTLKDGIDSILSGTRQPLTVTNVGTMTINDCPTKSGSDCLGYQGKPYFAIQVTNMFSTDYVDIALQPGVDIISADMEYTAQKSVTLRFEPLVPYMTTTMRDNKDRYGVSLDKYYSKPTGFFGTDCPSGSTLKTIATSSAFGAPEVRGCEAGLPSVINTGGYSIITTQYNLQLMSPGGNSPVKTVSYDYTKPTTTYLTDGTGLQAEIIPTKQTTAGIVPYSGDITVVTWGGRPHIYLKSNFEQYQRVWWNAFDYKNWLGVTQFNVPSTMDDYMQGIENEGLREIPRESSTSAALSGLNLYTYFPKTSMGTDLLFLIPQAMAQSVGVSRTISNAEIKGVTLSPTDLYFGGGESKLSITVKNLGGENTISTAIVKDIFISSRGELTSKVMSPGETFTFTHYVSLTKSLVSNTPVMISVTATGSNGIVKSETVTLNGIKTPVKEEQKCNPLTSLLGCKEDRFSITVQPLDPAGNVLGDSVVYINNQEKGRGVTMVSDLAPCMTDGCYIVSVSNVTGYYMPNSIPVTITDKDEILNMKYGLTPPSPPGFEYTWIVIGLLLIGLTLVLWRTGILASALKVLSNPLVLIANPVIGIAVIVLLLVIVFLLYMMIQNTAQIVSLIPSWIPKLNIQW